MNRNARLYTPMGVAVGTLLGTLAGAAALLWLNYRALGYPHLGNRVAATALAGYLLIVLLASFLPHQLWLGVLFVLLQVVLAHRATELLQGPAIRYHLARGVTAQPLAAAAAVGLFAGLAVMLALMMMIRLFGLGGGEPPPARF